MAQRTTCEQSRMKALTYLPDPFVLQPSTLSWIASRYPGIDVEETYAVFVDKALAKGWRYRDWNAAFRNYIRSGKIYGGVIYRNDRDHDPRWLEILKTARAANFRDPEAHETPQSYATAYAQYRITPRTNVVQFDVLKRVQK